MASLNSLGVGISLSDSGTSTSPRSLTMTADTGSKLVGEAMRPTSRMKLEKERACATSVRLRVAPAWRDAPLGFSHAVAVSSPRMRRPAVRGGCFSAPRQGWPGAAVGEGLTRAEAWPFGRPLAPPSVQRGV